MSQIEYTKDAAAIIRDLEKRIERFEISSTANNFGGWQNAGETWTYASSAGNNIYTFTVSGDKRNKYQTGLKVALVQTTTKYFIVVSNVSYNSGTDTSTVTIFGGTDYILQNAAISYPQFSFAKTPLDFPASPDKWILQGTANTNVYQSAPVSGTWYQIVDPAPGGGALFITVPVGVWNIEYFADMYASDSGNTTMTVEVTLSSTTNSETDTDLTCKTRATSASSFTWFQTCGGRSKRITITSGTTTYTLLARTVTASIDEIGVVYGLIKVTCALL